MPVQGLGWTFDTVAEAYDRYRPTYPDELYQDLMLYHQTGLQSHALEIGLGTGQATAPILATGCPVTAIEPGSHLARIARKKFGEEKLTVIRTTFEDYMCTEELFDLVYSASAFHWIAEEKGYPKVMACLRPGGAFARFASHPYYRIDGQEALWEDIQRCYQRHMPDALNAGALKAAQRYDEKAAQRRSAIASKYGFVDIATRTYDRSFCYTSAEYVQRLAIESDKIAMAQPDRERLLLEIAEAVERHGGYIIVRDMVDLNLARKPE